MPVTVKKGNIVARRPLDYAGDPGRAAVVERLNSLMRTTAIQVAAIASLTPNPRNTKNHPDKQIALLSKNIEQFGFHTPIITDDTGNILCGHARVEAAKLLGLDQVPIIRLEGLDRHHKSALAIADNRIGALGAFNAEILSQELAGLFDPEIELDFDPSIIG
ncbi:MAG: ParB/Srx family N-terminal domain-containing protein, partial [Candidatus Micrarchaeaceae archaeon]